MDTGPYELYISLDELAALWRGNTGWENEEPLRAAFTSLELYFLLIADAARDGRATARQDQRITRLWIAAAAQARLLGELLAATPLPPGTAVEAPSRATNLGLLCDFGPRSKALGVPTR